ncbi:remodeling and spacing factor 1-like [Dendronephthya gigantea]|uniref:remodeling and spacing factor 1-like n=1 Tax=Dendronephthya gigantea TaxID=151771 RepID=UPI00106B7238|nr:remodeling and spacing factor 1-like [Dendronephthya gigantea]
MASEDEIKVNDGNETNETDNKDAEEILLPTSKRSRGITKDPNFAVVCSFIKIFGPLLHFKELSIETLQQFFDSPTQDNQEDIQALFIKLLRRAGWRVVPEKWEKGLLKFVKEFHETIAWDLEQFGFRELSGEAKLAILKDLLESQFDNNDKFKSAVNCELSQVDLRPQPVGSDIDGLIYWFHEDELLQIRLYSTEEDELDCEAWKVLACEVEEIVNVVEFLEKKAENNPKDVAQEKKNERRAQRASQVTKAKKKKGRKSKKQAESNESAASDESDIDDDNPCARCYSSVHPEMILLCDKCDAAYHTACLRPPIMSIPAGDWFCPFCNTLLLIETLKKIYSRISTRIKARSRAANRKNPCGINLSNIRQSGRVRKTVDYTFSEFDQEIMEAVDRDGKKKQDVASSVVAIRGSRQSKRRRMLYNDSDSDSNYDPGSPIVEHEIPKHPQRHVYLRRHENGVETGNKDDVKLDQQEVLMKEDPDALQTDDVEYDNVAVEQSKSIDARFDASSDASSDAVGANINQNGDANSNEDIDNISELTHSLVDGQESVNTLDYQCSVSLNEPKNAVISSTNNTQYQTPAETVVDVGTIVNGKECTTAEPNCNIILNSPDINLIAEGNKQLDESQKNLDQLYGSIA